MEAVMNIPRTYRKQKMKEKKCQAPGCTGTFLGLSSSKYCPEHRDKKTRVEKSQEQTDENADVNNQIVQHANSEVKTEIMQCALKGCQMSFEVKIFPNQFVYPKYCPEHRNPHKRKMSKFGDIDKK